ncbi:MAG: tetratricopeptide repeat-containing diguanylate cyclase [Massilia sp.]
MVSLWLASSQAMASPQLDERLHALREVGRFVPHEALKELLALDAETLAASPSIRAEYLSQLSLVWRSLGQKKQAMTVADELLALGTAQQDKVALARANLAKGYVLFSMNELKRSHQYLWEGERLAGLTGDMHLKVVATIASGQAHAEEGNFPAALGKMQAALTLARQSGDSTLMTMAYSALIRLYTQMKQFDKGFEMLAEAQPVALRTGSPGRVALMKDIEYGLAIETGQTPRGLKVLHEALALERQIGATVMKATTLTNLSDSYLKLLDYPHALTYAQEALELARTLGDGAAEATARINIGRAQLGLGKRAEGRASFEAGLAFYDHSGDKPTLQAVLIEYGAALERAGDMAGAVHAYHRERALSNQLFEKRREKAIWELQEKYEADSRERQIELLRRDNQIKSADIDNRRLQQRVWWLLALVSALVLVIVFSLYRKMRSANAQLKVRNLELKQQSARDPLTGLYNRRHFQEYMRGRLERDRLAGARTGENLVGALFLLDVDHFKNINDTYGHAAGDAVLRMISENLREILCGTDMIVRWGGEEFLAFLPAISRGGLDEVARRLLGGISAQRIDYQGTVISVNVSIGFAPYPLAPAGAALPWERALNLVDLALYLAKSHGRNRAYGLRGFAQLDRTSLEEIEQDLEQAWRAGHVDLSVVEGSPAPARSAA